MIKIKGHTVIDNNEDLTLNGNATIAGGLFIYGDSHIGVAEPANLTISGHTQSTTLEAGSITATTIEAASITGNGYTNSNWTLGYNIAKELNMGNETYPDVDTLVERVLERLNIKGEQYWAEHGSMHLDPSPHDDDDNAYLLTNGNTGIGNGYVLNDGTPSMYGSHDDEYFGFKSGWFNIGPLKIMWSSGTQRDDGHVTETFNQSGHPDCTTGDCFERPPMVLVTRHRGNSINNFDPLRITLRDFTINRADGTDGSEKYSWIAIGI